MKKLVLSALVATVLLGCGSDSNELEDLEEQARTRVASRIVFDPASNTLNLPTDLLFAVVEQTDDGTLEVPDEIAGQVDGGMPDFTNPAAAIGALDGWSTQHPFSFSTEHPNGISLDPVSASTAGAVRIFEGAIGGDLEVAECTTAPAISGCQIGEELTFGVDFITQANGNDVVVIPLRPLQGAQTYYVVVTNALLSSDGEPVTESTAYESLSRDVNQFPLATESQLALQGLINSYEQVLVTQGGVPAESIIFSYTFTTQVTTDIISTAKQLQIAPFAQALAQGVPPAQAAQLLPAIPVNDSPTIDTAFDVFGPLLLGETVFAQLSAVGLGNCQGLTAAVSDPASPLFATAASVYGQAAPFCAASVKQGAIDLPYYQSTTAPLDENWEAACTNGLAIQTIGADNIPGLIANGTISTGQSNELCQAATQGRLFDLDLSNLGINDLRHITRFSPIPARQGRNPDGTETLDVQFTVPDVNIVNTLAAIPGSGVAPINKPENGWPIVIMQHGNTSRKEDFLIVSAALSVAGFATVAIDHPLHGSRGFLTDERFINASTGFGGRPSDFVGGRTRLNNRDNNRQSIVDTLGLRLGLNAIVDLTGGEVDIDESNVSFIGQSLGSITGIGTVAIANDSLGGDLALLDSMYSIRSAVLSVPGGGNGASGVDAPRFRSSTRGSVLAASLPAFQTFLASFAAENGLSLTDAIPSAFEAFEATLSEDELEALNPLFASFIFASQTIADSADPNNFAELIGTNTPILMHAVVGGGVNDDGSIALPDQVVPNSTISAPSFAGTFALARFMGLPDVSSSTTGSGLVRFMSGDHISLLDPRINVAATTEMQRQAVAFIASGGNNIVITDDSVIAN